MVRVHALFEQASFARISGRGRAVVYYLYYLMYPFHSYGSKHFENYVRLIQFHRSMPLRRQWWMIVVNSLLLYHVAHLIFVTYVYQPVHGTFANIINGDIVSRIVPTNSMRKVNISFTLLVIYVNKYLIYDQNIFIIKMLERILNNDSSFLIGDSKIKQYNMKCVQKFFYLLLNMCNTLILAMDLILIYVILYYTFQFWTAKRFFTVWGPFLFMLQMLNLGSGFCMLYCYSHTFTIVMSSSMSMALVFMLNFKQNQRKLEYWVKNQMLTPGRFELFQRRFENNIKYFFECNKVYGKIFFIVLMVNIPASANIIIQLITSPLNDYVRFTLYFICINQFFLIFLIHYYLTKPIKRIHGCSPILFTFLSGYCKKSERFDSGTMSKITGFLFMIHTDNYYGFTYSSYGLISMQTMLKYLVYYSKFSMVAYKLRYDMY